MKKNTLLNQKGQAALLVVSAICIISAVFFYQSSDLHLKNMQTSVDNFDQLLLDETTTSAIQVVEASLAKRMWESPPDNSCLKAESFTTRGKFEGGLEWEIETIYDFDTKNFTFNAVGKYRDYTSRFTKKVKVLDVSDYLILSTSMNTLPIARQYNDKSISAIIARDRRIYNRGPVVIGSHVQRTNPQTDWSGSPTRFPAEYGLIVQGDRVQFGGGLYTNAVPIYRPNDTSSKLYELLEPYTSEWGDAVPYMGQRGAGSLVVTKDFSKAISLKDQVLTGSGPLTLNDIEKEIYPTALFNTSSLPLKSWEAADDGSYFNQINKYSIFNYGYGREDNFGIRINATCLQKSSLWGDKAVCNHSEHFPKGFAAWKKDAGLDGVLYTSDAEEIPAPTFTWDNMKALEADAKKCGIYIDKPINAYQDCPKWEAGFLNDYKSGKLECDQVSRIDLDTLNFSNFSQSLSKGITEKRQLRRIIYSTVPIEIHQSNPRGFLSGKITNNNSRKKFPIWIVNENLTALKGYQADQTSPLDERPQDIREISFNRDVSGGNLEPLPMVLLSPNKIHLLSPFYKPTTPDYLNNYWPVKDGFIKPLIHTFTDYPREEDDGFKYGFRKFNIENVSIITNSAVGIASPFYLRGLYRGSDSSAEQSIINQCMISKEGVPLVPFGSNRLRITAEIPSYINDTYSPIPPLTSKFYNGDTTRLPSSYYPSVFTLQKSYYPGKEESEVQLTGVRVELSFVDTSSNSIKLNTVSRRVVDRHLVGPFLLDHKHFEWADSFYFQTQPANTACLKENVSTRTGLVTNMTAAVSPIVNAGGYILMHIDPPTDYRDLGSLFGVEQPILQGMAN